MKYCVQIQQTEILVLFLTPGSSTWDVVDTCIRVPVKLKMWYLSLSCVFSDRKLNIPNWYQSNFFRGILWLRTEFLRMDANAIHQVRRINISFKKITSEWINWKCQHHFTYKISAAWTSNWICFAFSFAPYLRGYDTMLTFGTICFVRSFVARQPCPCD